MNGLTALVAMVEGVYETRYTPSIFQAMKKPPEGGLW